MNAGWQAAAIVLFLVGGICVFVGMLGLMTQIMDESPVLVPAAVLTVGLALALMGAVCIGVAS